MFNSNEYFMTTVSMMCALVFVPPEEVVHVFENYIKPSVEEAEVEWFSDGFEDEVTSFMKYFVRTFLDW